MTNKDKEELQEKLIFHRFLIGFAVTMIVLVAASDWYPAIKELFNVYMWTVIVFGFIVIVRRRMLYQWRFWLILIPIFVLHILFMWKEIGPIMKTDIWLLFFPIVIEALLIQAVIQVLSSMVMARKK